MNSYIQQQASRELGSAFDILVRSSSPEEAAKTAEIILKWKQHDKNSFIYQYSLITKVVLGAVVNMPHEMQSVLCEGQAQTIETVHKLTELAQTLVDNIEFARSEFQTHWSIAVQERNDTNAMLECSMAALKEVIQRNSASARERETAFMQMVKQREDNLNTSLLHREAKTTENINRAAVKARYVSAGIIALAAVFCTLFYISERRSEKIFELESRATIESRVSERLQQVQPSTLQMASAFERGGRQVVLQDGTLAYEVDLSEVSGFFYADVVQDGSSRHSYVRVLMRNDPNRMSLDALSAATKNSVK